MLRGIRRLHMYLHGARRVLRVTGRESGHFLQGLTTNDVELLNPAYAAAAEPPQHAQPSQYTLFLNAKGRVLCESVLYRLDDDHFLLDVDSEQTGPLLHHLGKYNLRKKTIVTDVSDELAVLAVANEPGVTPESVVAGGADPRFRTATIGDGVSDLQRFIVTRQADVDNSEALREYLRLRLRLGVSEGGIDHQPEHALPLQCNVDYLNGVSFVKGCYLGQELTTRTHFTGVVRKRIVPLTITDTIDAGVDITGADIFAPNHPRAVGTVYSNDPSQGLAVGLLRLESVGQPLQIAPKSSDTGTRLACQASLPLWWPETKQDLGRVPGSGSGSHAAANEA